MAERSSIFPPLFHITLLLTTKLTFDRRICKTHAIKALFQRLNLDMLYFISRILIIHEYCDLEGLSSSIQLP